MTVVALGHFPIREVASVKERDKTGRRFVICSGDRRHSEEGRQAKKTNVETTQAPGRFHEGDLKRSTFVRQSRIGMRFSGNLRVHGMDEGLSFLMRQWTETQFGGRTSRK